MYDAFSSDYDRFVHWPGRLDFELPFVLQVVKAAAGPGQQSARVLDVACGTGIHTIELTRRGFDAVGTDLSAGMVERARENARIAGLETPFYVAGFTGLRTTLASAGEPDLFDVLLCLGNSLPHVDGPEELQAALLEFAGCLRPGGFLLLQNRNFDAVLAHRERWMEPQSHQEGEREWLFLRFYDYRPDGRIDFNMVSLKRRSGEPWQQQVMSTRLYPIVQADLAQALTESGFERATWHGSMTGAPFEPETSGNLIVVAVRA